MCVHFFNFDNLRIKIQSSVFFNGTKFRALLFLSILSSSSTIKLLSMASYGGELLLDSSCPWSGISSLSSFSILLPFIFQEVKEFIDEEDPRPTSSNGAYITFCPSITPYTPRKWEHGTNTHKKKNITKSYLSQVPTLLLLKVDAPRNYSSKSLETLTLTFHPLYSWLLAISSYCTSQIVQMVSLITHDKALKLMV